MCECVIEVSLLILLYWLVSLLSVIGITHLLTGSLCLSHFGQALQVVVKVLGMLHEVNTTSKKCHHSAFYNKISGAFSFAFRNTFPLSLCSPPLPASDLWHLVRCVLTQHL